jgi:hypothetical protein
MAVKNSKATTAPDLVEQSAAPLSIDIDLEDDNLEFSVN